MTPHTNNFSPNFSISQRTFVILSSLTLFTVLQVNRKWGVLLKPKVQYSTKKSTCFVLKHIYIYIYREELNIASLYIYILNVDKINNGLKIMYSAPLDNTKALAVWGAKC